MTFKTLSLVTATLLLTTNTFAEEQLRDITVVTANKTVQSIQNTTSDVTVITAEDIEENGYFTVAEAISTVAGISVTNAGGLGQQTSFFVRGADSGKVLVLLDGMRLNDPSTPNGTALLNSLTTNTIQQIEIVKGGTSSIWGSNASAGVINIITKKPADGVHGTVGLSYGSYATKGVDVNLAYKDDKFTAQLLSAYLSSDSFSALAPRSAEADAYTNKNYNLKLGYMFDENNQLSLSYNRIKTETEYDSTYPTLNPNDSETSSDSDQTNIALTYTFHLENYTATLNASQGQYERGYPYGKYEADLKEYSLINAYKYNNGKVILGLEYKDIDGNPGEAYTNKAIFLSNVYNINEHTLLESNLRYDDFNNFTNKTTYKLGIKHSPDLFDDLTVTANYSTAYDAPSAYQIANVATALGTTQLKPAFTKGYDLSIEYKKLLKLTYFNNKVEDSFDYYSDWDQDYLDGDGYYNAPGTSKFSGLEVESILPLNEIFTLTTNYTHLIKYEKDDGLKFDKRAKDTLNLMLNAYTDNKTYYGINAHYIGDRKEFGNSTGNYTLWNLNFGTNIMEDVDVSIHAKNIFDKDYQSVYGYATEGRSFYANLKYSF